MTDGRLSNEELVDVLSDVEDSWMTIDKDEGTKLASKLRKHIATLQREADETRESLARWMLENSFATGHGDTISDLLSELKFQLEEQKARAHEIREALSGILDLISQEENTFLICEHCGFQDDDWLKESDLIFLPEPLRERARAALKALPPQQDANQGDDR